MTKLERDEHPNTVTDANEEAATNTETAQLHTRVVPLRTDAQAAPETTSGPPTLKVLPLSLSPVQRLLLRRTARLLMIGGLIFWIGQLLWTTREALIPFMVGLALAYVLLPLVNRLSQWMPRWAAILSVYFISLLVVSISIWFLVPPLVDQVRELITNAPSVAQLQTQGNRFLGIVHAYLPPSLDEPFNQAVNRVLTTVQNNLTSYLSRVGGFVVNSVLTILDTVVFLIGFLVIPFWMFYVMNDYQAGLKTVNNLLPVGIRDDFWALVRIIDQIFSKYIRGQLFLGLVVGIMSGIGLFILNLLGFNVNYVLVLALIAGVTELIPIIGPIIGAVPAIIVGMFDGPGTALAVTLLYVIIQQVENQVLVPRIVGESVGISPALMFVLLAVATQAFGLIGAILAAPVAAAIRDIVVYLNNRLSDPKMD